MSVVVVGRCDARINGTTPESYKLLQSTATNYGTDATTQASPNANLRIVPDNIHFTGDMQLANVTSDTSSASPTSPSTTRQSDCEFDAAPPVASIAAQAQYRADGGRYSITITGHKTRNTAERVLGVHKPYFSLSSPVHDHDPYSSHSVPRLDDEYWGEELRYTSLQTTYGFDDRPSVVMNSGESDMERRSSVTVNPMNIIVFLTNLYLRFRRLFDLKNTGSNASSPQRKRSDVLVNEVAPRVYYGTNQLPNGFIQSRNFACALYSFQAEFSGNTHASASVREREAAVCGCSDKPFEYARNGPCVFCNARTHTECTESTLHYLHQAHRRFDVHTNIDADEDDADADAASAPNSSRTVHCAANVQNCAAFFPDRRLDQPSARFDSQTQQNAYCTSPWPSEASSSHTTMTGTEASRGRFGGSRAPLVPAVSCPAPPVKSKSIDRSPKITQDFLGKSWPPLQRKVYSSVEDDLDEDFGLFDVLKKPSTQTEYEFNIPHRDIKFLERISQGVREAIYRGQWHGEVWVHTYWDLTHSETKRFWEEVSRLSMIRHENVALFMGACMDPPRFAIVSTLRKYPTLYEKLHLMRDTMSQRTKVSITKQIAQAVSYLHAKNILVKRLHSAMIYLDPKVKLYLINLCLDDVDGHAVIRRRDLPYIAPEILRSVRIEPHIPYLRVADNLFTAESDTYAFGTLMYEIFAASYPFEKLEMDAFVWCACTGKREDTEQLCCSEVIRSLIQDCWAHDSLCRPEMFEINSLLSQPGVLRKRCSSDPERLNRVGLHNVF